MRIVFVLAFLLSSCAQLDKAPPVAECFGDERSKRAVVYLHGMDVPEKSPQERENREIILRIAKQIGARVAIPRALRKCPGSTKEICWGWKFDDSELFDIRQQIENAAAFCGAPPSFELIGFSNGGYAVNKLFEKCMMKPDQHWISVGAGNRPYRFNTAKLESCGRLTLIVGRLDRYNNNGAQLYLDSLMSRGAKVQMIEHPGHHDIPEEILLKVLKSE